MSRAQRWMSGWNVIALSAWSGLAAGLLEHGLVDRWIDYVAPKIVGGFAGPGPIGGEGVQAMAQAVSVPVWRVRRSGPDIVIDSILNKIM